MVSLERMLELVRRTGLPMVIPSVDEGEPCILMPLRIYEELGGGGTSSGSALPTLSRSADGRPKFDADAARSMRISTEAPIALSLQDLLQESAPVVQSSVSIVSRLQDEGLEDRLAFDGEDAKIFPQTRQKTPTTQPMLDQSGPTLA